MTMDDHDDDDDTDDRELDRILAEGNFVVDDDDNDGNLFHDAAQGDMEEGGDDDDDDDALDKLVQLLAVSVHYLQTSFQQDFVDAAGLNRQTCTLHEICAAVLLPKCHDSDTSFVHYLMKEQAGRMRDGGGLGTAQYLLSYDGATTLTKVCDALQGWCDRDCLEPPQTFVWMYCFNTPLHRLGFDLSREERIRKKRQEEAEAAALEEAQEKLQALKKNRVRSQSGFQSTTTSTTSSSNAATTTKVPPTIAEVSSEDRTDDEDEDGDSRNENDPSKKRKSNKQQREQADALEEELAQLRRRLVNIGHLLVLMSPWNKPRALENTWCNFEIYVAAELQQQLLEEQEAIAAKEQEQALTSTTENTDTDAKTKKKNKSKTKAKEIQITVLLPPSDKMTLEQHILGEYNIVNDLYKLLGSTKIQTTTASMHGQQDTLLHKAESELGGFPIFNLKVNAVLRRWFRQVVDEMKLLKEECRAGNTNVLSKQYAIFFDHLAILFDGHAENQEAAKEMRRRAQAIRDSITGVFTIKWYKEQEDLQQQQQQQQQQDKETENANNNDSSFNSSINKAMEGSLSSLSHKSESSHDKKNNANATTVEEEVDITTKYKTLIAYHNVAAALAKKGDHDGSLVNYGKAMLIQETIFGKLHPNTAMVYSKIGDVLHDKGELAGAIIAYKRALESQLASLGEEHPATATTHIILGRLLEEQGDYNQAAIQYAKGQELVGKDHPKMTEAYEKAELALRRKKDVNGALREFQKGCVVREMVLRQDPTVEAAELTAEGRALVKEGDLDGALLEYRKALDLKIAALGPNHPEIALARNHIGALLLDKKDTDGALIEFRAVLRVYQAIDSPDHDQDKATAHNNVGVLLKDKEEYDEALEHLRCALSIRKSVLGEKNLATATTLFYIGEVLAKQEQYEEAETELRKAFLIFKSALGKENPRTEKVKESIVTVRKAIKRKKKEMEQEEENKEGLSCCEQIKEFLKAMMEQ